MAKALAITAILGGVTGAALLLASGEEIFRYLVPWLILFATLLLAFQTPLRRLVAGARGDHGEARLPVILVPIFAATVYGGYFGAGLGIAAVPAGRHLSDSHHRVGVAVLVFALPQPLLALVAVPSGWPWHRWAGYLAMVLAAANVFANRSRRAVHRAAPEPRGGCAGARRRVR
jgi:uncharacterized membrane protein YfcA